MISSSLVMARPRNLVVEGPKILGKQEDFHRPRRPTGAGQTPPTGKFSSARFGEYSSARNGEFGPASHPCGARVLQLAQESGVVGTGMTADRGRQPADPASDGVGAQPGDLRAGMGKVSCPPERQDCERRPSDGENRAAWSQPVLLGMRCRGAEQSGDSRPRLPGLRIAAGPRCQCDKEYPATALGPFTGGGMAGCSRFPWQRQERWTEGPPEQVGQWRRSSENRVMSIYVVSVPKYRVLNPARRYRPRRPARDSAPCAVNERLGAGFARISRMPAIFRHEKGSPARAGAHADGVGSAGRSQAARRMPWRR